MKRPRKFLASVIVGAALASGLAAGAQPVSAATGGVYIVAPKSWGWCPDIRGVRNSVWAVSVTNATNGYSQTDFGDDIGWVKANIGSRNTVHVNIGCTRGHGSTGTVVSITPRRNGQTFFVSPTGYSWGN